MNNEDTIHYVCQICGYNMVGYHPDFCPFCGAKKTDFCRPKKIQTAGRSKEPESVTRINSVSALGYEHAAYRVVADRAVF